MGAAQDEVEAAGQSMEVFTCWVLCTSQWVPSCCLVLNTACSITKAERGNFPWKFSMKGALWIRLAYCPSLLMKGIWIWVFSFVYCNCGYFAHLIRPFSQWLWPLCPGVKDSYPFADKVERATRQISSPQNPCYSLWYISAWVLYMWR